MSFLLGSLTRALLRSCHRKVISHSDGHLVVGCRRKQKEPVTQSTKNRREHSSRFKVMFYVIGSENSKSGSAFLLLPPTEPKAWWSSSALPVYRYRVGWNRLMVEHWYLVVPPLYRYITYPSRFWMSLTIFGISKSRFQRKRKKIPLLVRTFRSDLSTVWKTLFENCSHIPPEKTVIFVPCAENFFSSGSRWGWRFGECSQNIFWSKCITTFKW